MVRKGHVNPMKGAVATRRHGHTRSVAAGRRGAILVSVLWVMVFLAFVAVVLRLHVTGIAQSIRVTEGKAAARIVAEAALAHGAALVLLPQEPGQTPSPRLTGSVETANGRATFRLVNESVRIDLNSGDRALIMGALIASGAPQNQADAFAEAILAGREEEEEDPQDPEDAAPSLTFHNASEIVLLAGMTPEIAIGMERLTTVSSGLAGIRLDEADRDLLASIPGFPRSALAALDDYEQGRIDRIQLMAELGQLAYHVDENTPSWRAVMDVELPTGYGERYEALIAVLPDDTRPYRVLGWRRVDEATGRTLE